MFEWKVEDMSLLNEKTKFFLGQERIFDCESEVSREDKIAFVDKMINGELSYLLSLIQKFKSEKENLPKDNYGYIKSVSLKAWITRNDKKYVRTIIDNWHQYGQYRILGSERYIQYNSKGMYDTYEDLVDECFHRQLKICLNLEERYFKEHDEASILRKQVSDYSEKYHTTFGAKIGVWSNGNITVSNEDGEDRNLTVEELKVLVANYQRMDALVEEITAGTHITYGESREITESEPDEIER